MSKRAEELANKLYPDPKIEDYDDILVYRADRDNAIMGRANAICIYEQAEKDLALTWEDVRAILHTASSYAVEASKGGIKSPDLDTEEHYTKILKRFNETRK